MPRCVAHTLYVSPCPTTDAPPGPVVHQHATQAPQMHLSPVHECPSLWQHHHYAPPRCHALSPATLHRKPRQAPCHTTLAPLICATAVQSPDHYHPISYSSLVDVFYLSLIYHYFLCPTLSAKQAWTCKPSYSCLSTCLSSVLCVTLLT